MAKAKGTASNKANSNGKKRTSIGSSKRSRPKHKGASKKRNRGQG